MKRGTEINWRKKTANEINFDNLILVRVYNLFEFANAIEGQIIG